MGGSADFRGRGFISDGEEICALWEQQAESDFSLREAVRVGVTRHQRRLSKISRRFRPSEESRGPNYQHPNTERCLVMVHGKQKDVAVDSLSCCELDGRRADSVVRAFIKSKQSKVYRGAIGTLKVIAIGTLGACILLTVPTLYVLSKVREVTADTNASIKPLVTPEAIDQAKRDKRAIDHITNHYIEQLKYFHKHPDRFDQYIQKLNESETKDE